MSGSKSDRKLKAEFNLFDEVSRKGNQNIRVGYIDPKRGYIDGLSVYEANKYAEKNPGTQFIFKTRDKIRYLNINKVNKLLNENAVPINSPIGLTDEDGLFDACNTVKGFNTSDNEVGGGEPDIEPPRDPKSGIANNKERDCEVRVVIEGGGGVGAIASPIIGTDGSLIHVRVIDGGFGYKFPPQAKIIDECKRGSGASAFAVLGTESSSFTENFDAESDVELYNFELDNYQFDPEQSIFGKLYDIKTNKVIGDWDPKSVINLERDSQGSRFERELQDYLEFLRSYDPNKPWWTTRDETPLKVVGNGKKSISRKLGNGIFPVEHLYWGAKEDNELVDVEFGVYGQGSQKNRSIFFKFEAEDGSHSFKIKGVTAQNRSGKTRSVIESVKVNTTYKVTSNIRKSVDNRESIQLEQGLLEEGGRNATEAKKLQKDGGRSRIIFADVIGSANDNDDIQVTASQGKFKAGEKQDRDFGRGSFDLTYRFNRPLTEIKNTFMNKYAVSPELPSNRQGTDRAGKPYIIKYKEYFPHDGKYTFRGICDNKGEVYFDGELLFKMNNVTRGKDEDARKPTKINKKVKEGIHEIKVELENKEKKEIVKRTFTSSSRAEKKNSVNVKFNVVGSGSGRHRSISAVFQNQNDTSETFVIDNKYDNNEVREVIRTISAGDKYTVKFVPTAKVFDEGDSKTQKLPITYVGIEERNVEETKGSKVSIKSKRITDKNRTIKLFDEVGKDSNAVFKIKSQDPGIEAKFSDDGSELIVKNFDKKNKKVSLKLTWDDNPKKDGRAIKSIKILDKVWKVSGSSGSITLDLDIVKKIPESSDGNIEQGVIENGTKVKEGGGSSSNRIFADYIGSINDNDDMQIFVEKGGEFTASNRDKSSGRSTYDLEFVFDRIGGGLRKDLIEELSDLDIIDAKTGQSFELDKEDIEKAEVFDTKTFIDKANRDLYRVNPGVGRFGDFFSKFGITPFNPLEIDPEIKDVKPTKSSEESGDIKVKFRRKGGPNGDLFLKVIGKGKAKIEFQLKVDDNPTTSGLALREVSIENDGDLLKLVRNIEKQVRAVSRGVRYQYQYSGNKKETITGSAEFTGGKEYKIISSGGSSGSGYQSSDSTIIFDDNYANGWDNDAGLTVTNINPIGGSKSSPSKVSVKDNKNVPSKKMNLDDVEGSTDDYAGTHEIRWKNIKFPASGTYALDIQVDDNVILEFINQSGRRVKDLVVAGFIENRNGKLTSKGLQTFFIDIEKGKYTIKAQLIQRSGKSIINGNPMGLAMRIKTQYLSVKEEVTLRQSWNENPFGFALTINAPLPPVPKEKKVKKSDCPPNPIWTTRQPAQKQWYPCNHISPSGAKTWSKFMNRYAMSPVLPLGTLDSGYSGSSWQNTWVARIPFDGFYNFQATVDDRAKIFITSSNGSETEIKRINRFKTEKGDLLNNRVFLTEGEAKINVTLENFDIEKSERITEKIFDTADWVEKSTKSSDTVPVDFKVYGKGSNQNIKIKAIFQQVNGDHTFTIRNVDKSDTIDTISKNIKTNVDYFVQFVPTGSGSNNKEKESSKIETRLEIPIKYNLGNPRDFGFKRSDSKKTLKFDDNIGNGFDKDVSLKIESTSPGLDAKFSKDGERLVITGTDNGDVTIKFKWDDDPEKNGKVFGSIKIGDVKFKQKGESGEQTETIKIGSGNFSASGITENRETFRIKYTEPGEDDRGPSASNYLDSDTKIVFLDSPGDGKDDNSLEIEDIRGDINVKFSSDMSEIIAEGTGEGSFDVVLKWDDNPSEDSDGKAIGELTIDDKEFKQKGKTGSKRKTFKVSFTKRGAIETRVLEQGCLESGFGKKGSAQEGRKRSSNTIFADFVESANNDNDMQIQCTTGIFTPANKTRVFGDTGRGTWDLYYRFDDDTSIAPTQVTEVDGASYEVKDKILDRKATVTAPGTVPNRDNIISNPTLTTYERGKLGRLLSPFFESGTKETGKTLQGRTWEIVWDDVLFPTDGEYEIEIEADDFAQLEISRQKVEVANTNGNYKGENSTKKIEATRYDRIGTVERGDGVQTFISDIKAGKRKVRLTLQNTKISGTNFSRNPVYVGCKISCVKYNDVGDRRSWLVNPVGISAVLISPPCPKIIAGIGTVAEIIIREPGNGLTAPLLPDPGGISVSTGIGSFDVTGIGTRFSGIGTGVGDDTGIGTLGISTTPSFQVRITGFTTTSPGIGYTGGDSITIINPPGDGDGSEVTIPIIPGDFGKVVGLGEFLPIPITQTPIVTINTRTGSGFKGFPKTDLVVDPIGADPRTLIQITDLAGLKQNGYIEGRPYYGEVFFKDGIPYAGRYETAGRLIQVYATLQESIDGQVTTRPSAIQRSGTDISSNNPRLNIPGTPDNLA